MTEIISSVAEVRGDKIYAQLYAYTVNERGDADTVRDNNHALEIVRRLAGDSGQYFKEGSPPKGTARMFDVWMHISNTRQGKSRYTADYFRHPGCPQTVAAAMMDIYRTIKSVLRESVNSRRERKQQMKGTNR